MKNNWVKMFSYNKNGVGIEVFSYPRDGVRIRKIKMMRRDLSKTSPSKIHHKIKMVIKMNGLSKTSPSKIHYQIRVMMDNPDKAHSEQNKVGKNNKNKVHNYKWSLVDNYKDVKMINNDR